MATATITPSVFTGEIPSPLELKNYLPLSDKENRFIETSRETVRDILLGNDPRLILVVGPCSIHDLESAYAYAEKLHDLAQEVKNVFYIVMRTYFEKPRTSRGWKGFIYDPFVDGTFDLAGGLFFSRQLLKELITLGLPAGSELLEIHTAPYISDLLTWGCIGARTCTSQPHRQLASAMPFPMGFKNSTDGNILNALHGILAARDPHTFLGLNERGVISRIQSRGNSDCHVILRGSHSKANYDIASVHEALHLLHAHALQDRLVIDCSHDNCKKNPAVQVEVFENVIRQLPNGHNSVRGLMLESHLRGGSQAISSSLEFGISITDPCLDWESTYSLVIDMANLITQTSHFLG